MTRRALEQSRAQAQHAVRQSVFDVAALELDGLQEDALISSRKAGLHSCEFSVPFVQDLRTSVQMPRGESRKATDG